MLSKQYNGVVIDTTNLIASEKDPDSPKDVTDYEIPEGVTFTVGEDSYTAPSGISVTTQGQGQNSNVKVTAYFYSDVDLALAETAAREIQDLAALRRTGLSNTIIDKLRSC